MIEIFKDRVEISNPGGLPSGLTDETFGTKSVPRNLLIADLLLRSSYIERIGTGINRIKNAVKEHGYSKVRFEYDEHWFKVVFIREQEAKLRAEFGEVLEKSGHGAGGGSGYGCGIGDGAGNGDGSGGTKEITSTSEQTSEEILKLMRTNHKITAIKIADKLKITSRAIEYHISILKRTSKIERIGSNKSGSWKVLD